MIVKQLTLTSKGLCPIEIPELPCGENVEAITAYTIEQIGEILFNSIIPIRDRFFFDFEKELIYPPEGEVVELDVIYPDDFDGTNIMQIDVDAGSISNDYRDTFMVLISDLAAKLVKEVEGEEPAE